MFHQKLDYTFYRKDVILDDQILNKKFSGLDLYVNYMATISFTLNFFLPYADLEVRVFLNTNISSFSGFEHNSIVGWWNGQIEMAN